MEYDIPEMSRELVNELEKQGAGATPFLIFIDPEKNETRMLRNLDYVSKPLGSGQKASEILAVSSVAIASFKGSPTCWWVNNNGSWELICEKIN